MTWHKVSPPVAASCAITSGRSSKALSPVIKRALDVGIPVVTVDSDSEAKDRLSYIGTDNRASCGSFANCCNY
jgi:ABC-type sugar transport system substrate-binding protein